MNKNKDMYECDYEQDLGENTPEEWVNIPKLDELKNNFEQAKSDRDAQIAIIDDWKNQLNVEGAYKPKARTGRSKIQPKIIRKQNEWRYPALSEPFLATPDIFSIKPRTWADTESARQNELILNYQFNNQMDKIPFIDTLVRTLVDEGTGIIRVSWENEEELIKEFDPVFKYYPASVEQTKHIQRAMKMLEHNPNGKSQLDIELVESVEESARREKPYYAKVVDYVEVEKVKVIRNQPNVSLCDYRNFTVDPTCEGDLDKAQFIIYSFESNKSELESTGLYFDLDKIRDESDASTTGDYQNLNNDTTFQFKEDARRKLVVNEYWGYWDIYDTGITEPVVISWVDDVIVRMELNPYPDGKLPFVSIPYLPVKYSIYGQADAELLGDNQRVIGALVRGQIDSMGKSAAGQKGVQKNALDALNMRKFKSGDDYEFNPSNNPASLIYQHQYPELPASSFNMLQMFNADSESLTGVKTYNTGMTGDSLGTTAAGVNSVVTASSQRELNIVRRIADGLSKVAKKILAMNAEWLTDDEIIRVTDEKFLTINRENLLGSFDVVLTIANTQSDNIKAQELSFMMQTMGGILPFELTQHVLSEIASLRNMPELSHRIKEYQPKPDQSKQLELERLKLENNKILLEIEQLKVNNMFKSGVQTALEQAKADKAKAEANLTLLEGVEQETGVTHERQLDLVKSQAKSNVQRDLINKTIDNTLQQQSNKPTNLGNTDND